MRGVILQPGYIPWLGFFNQMMLADVFIFLDDVQYDKRGWRNRNKINGSNAAIWLTIPVKSKGKYHQKLNEAEIDNSTSWPQKHLCSIKHNYFRTPFFEKYFPEVESILLRPWKKLVDLDIALIELMAGWLEIKTKTLLASDLKIENSDKTGRLVEICKWTGINDYLSGPLCMDYMDFQQLESNNINLWLHHYQHPKYTQQSKEFIPYLSTLDLLFNEGNRSSSILFDPTAAASYK